jgi:hypothetical protein
MGPLSDQDRVRGPIADRTDPFEQIRVRVSANGQPGADGSEPAGDEARSLAAGLTRMDCAMMVKSCSRWNGFVRKPVAPAASRSHPASTVPLMRTMGNSGRRECNISIISRPSITGIATSVKTRRTSGSQDVGEIAGTAEPDGIGCGDLVLVLLDRATNQLRLWRVG